MSKNWRVLSSYCVPATYLFLYTSQMESVFTMEQSSAQPLTDTGMSRFFKNQTFHFQTLRALNDIASGGADLNEVLMAISQIPDGDNDSWYEAFSALAIRTEERIPTYTDSLSCGQSWLRAHTYWRTAEFLLTPTDPRRNSAWDRQVAAFDKGLALSNVPHQRFTVPYENKQLRAIFYPGPEGWQQKPLIMLCGGFDSTLEELYFTIVKAASDRGYAVLTYEGPGQGGALRQQGLKFTPEWEKPTGAVLDQFENNYFKPAKIVMIGMSLGGYFAPRVAAFDKRISGVVTYDVFFDAGSIGQRYASAAKDPKALNNPDVKWATDNTLWTMGVPSMTEAVKALSAYSLAGVAEKVTADVLILAGERDHFIPPDQLQKFEKACTKAKSVETVLYDVASGGAEHCQLGAPTLWHADVFSWIARKFS